ncbi:chitinase 1 precursor [Fusarium albosuccineum]|uniref:Chitinase 1 n=1 Tax=Fusarium albosuccineum TaxID=1237068 RepID=A0A8H4NWV6_9HYPO|nr:chitinase 1 precursor [Fusarium albosuccineum]
MSSGVVRSTALRAGGACVRCRKGKTKCVYENGRAPCKNCAKGMHDCYLPSESMAHHHGQSPARHANPHRPPRDSMPASGPGGAAEARQAVVGNSTARHVQAGSDKYVLDFLWLFLSLFLLSFRLGTSVSPATTTTALTAATHGINNKTSSPAQTGERGLSSRKNRTPVPILSGSADNTSSPRLTLSRLIITLSQPQLPPSSRPSGRPPLSHTPI